MTEQHRKKGYQVDEDTQMRLESLPGVTCYTLEGALGDAIGPVYSWFLDQTRCGKCAVIQTRSEVIEILDATLGSLGSLRQQHLFCKEHEDED